MDQTREENLEERILELFKRENVLTIVLAGKEGIGKSWMARKVDLRALREGLFDISLWVYMGVKQNKRSLYCSIARQLSLSSTIKDLEINENDVAVDMVDEEEEDLEGMKNKILARVLQHRLLLILDEEGKKMNKKEEEIKELLQFFSRNTSKVLITSVNEDRRHKTEGSQIVIDLKPLIPEKYLSLVQEKAGAKVFQIPGAKVLVENFIRSNIGLTPAEAVMFAKILSYHQHDSGVQRLERALEEAYGNNKKLAIPLSSSGFNKVPAGVLLDFNFQDSHFFRNQGSIHYSELLAYWMMEGYLGDVDHIEAAYEKGHDILMELMDLQILKKVNNDYLVMENLTLNLRDSLRRGFVGTATLGLANVFADSNNWRGFGEVSQTDGIVKTLGSNKGGKHSTLLLDGNCLSRQDLDHLLQSDEELQIVGLFFSRLQHFPQSLTDKKNLNVLVLRGCDYLEKIVNIKRLGMLTVLEISNARSLTSIPEDFFTHLIMLRSLNLSCLQIEMLPISLYDLTELRWLILKGCSKLIRLQSLRKCRKLEVIDLSGAVSFNNFAETSLKSMPKLKFLDLSNTKIRILPFLHEIGQLTHLLASGCKKLYRLPSIQSLTKLQVLDVSGSSIKEFQDKSFLKNVNLRILDVSGTALSSLPSNMITSYFYLKDCSRVETINCFESPEQLESLDFSGASSLVNIEAKFFEHMKNLRILNLSKTKVKVLPPLCGLQNLRQLLLSCCLDLLQLPALNFLSKLEVLDLSGCRELTILEDETFESMSRLQRLSLSETKIEALPELRSLSNLEELTLSGVTSLRRADFLENMSKLRVLDLSETLIEKLPSMPCFENLTHLSLRNCKKIVAVPNLEKFTKLELLDLSGTSIRQLPSLKGLSNLRQLLLKECLSLEELADIQTLDLSGVVIGGLPYGISELTELCHLALPDTRNIQGSESNKVGCSDAHLNQCQWAISSVSRKLSDTNRILVSLNGSEYLELLEKNHSLLETNFKDCHFSIHPIVVQNGTGGIYFRRDDYVFTDIYFQSRHFPHMEGWLDVLEIRGFHNFPKGIENVLSHAKYIALLDNLFMKSLADWGTDNLKMMKGCWIERCQNMESLVEADSVGELVELGKNLEILFISYALNFKSLCIENLQVDCFHTLKYLHLDCCPGLSSLFSLSHFLQNLETLEIRFCDRMKTLFDGNSEEHVLPHLNKLCLWEMAELESIGCKMPSLQLLEVVNCSMLEHVLSSACMPEYLKVLKVKFCDNLHNLIDGLTGENHKFPGLHTIQLCGLPKLMSTGIDMTSVPVSSIEQCPKLQISVP